MAKFFMIQSRDPAKDLSYKDADRLATKMAEKIPDRRVTLLAVRKCGRHGFVYGVASRRAADPVEVVERLRRQTAFGHIWISAAAEAPDGPFNWE